MIDLTTNAGHGFLLEMSLIELKERLEIIKNENEENNRNKHDAIVKMKSQKEKDLVEKLQFINKFRNEKKSNLNESKK